MIKVLFVCHGNICRSPMAEYLFKDMVKRMGKENDFLINSAATSREEIGNPVHHGTRKKLAEFGITCSDKRAIQMTSHDYESYDYILAMDSFNLRNMRPFVGNDPEGKVHLLLDYAGGGDIADPWYTGNFDDTYNDIMKGLKGFISHLQ